MTKTIVFGGGCFWCTEAVFQRVKGVSKVISGYAGGGTETEPNYWSLHSGEYGHAEVIKVTYDKDIVPLDILLKIFFGTHDPTTNQQPGTGDKGSEYRSIILCEEDELKIAEKAKQEAQEYWDNPIITEIKPLDMFYPAEKNHQDFYNRNQSNGYCVAIIDPKLAKFKEKYQEHIKD